MEEAINEEVAPVKLNGEIPLDEITGAQPELAERLCGEHLELFRPALDTCVAANENLVAAQERFNAAVKAQQAAAGALTYVMEFLKPKYQMSPIDDFDREGNILRKGA